MAYFILTLTFAFLITYLLTPLIIKLAHKWMVMDKPDSRKIHTRDIPKLGGIAIYLGYILSLGLIFVLSSPFKELILSKTIYVKGIFIACTLMLVTGIIDDILTLKPKIKLWLQLLAAFILIYYDVKIDFITNPFNGIYYLTREKAFILTIFWIVGIINAINLLDGLDGLLSGVSVISATILFLVSLQLGQILPAFFLLALIGSCLAFLQYNFHPAKIFMGDTGSLFLGTLWASISIIGTLKTTTVTVLVPILILGLPIFDTTYAILRRFWSKTPIFQADKGHIHHCLLRIGLNQRQAVLSIYILCAILGGIALIISTPH